MSDRELEFDANGDVTQESVSWLIEEYAVANQRITTLESDLAAANRRIAELEARMKQAKECARCDYPKHTSGFAPWRDCGECVGCQCRAALGDLEAASQDGGA